MTTYTISGPFPYLSPVDGAVPNPAAHGGVAWLDERADGKTRKRNTNQGYTEVGLWL